MKPVGVAVIGTGYWGTKLIREYSAIAESTGEARLVWVIDSSEPALGAIKKVVRPGTSLGKSYMDALTDPAVEAIHIAIPNELHFEIARAALESKKHVLLEKPLATSSRDAFKLAALAEERGVVLQVGHIFRFNNAIRMLRKMIRANRIGKVRYARLSWATFMTPPKGRDIVSDLGPHPVDILNFLIDEWPVWVDAIGHSHQDSNPDAEDMAFVNLEFPEKVLANVYLSWVQHGIKERIVQVVGEKGTISCDALNQTVSLYTDDVREEIPREKFPSSREGDGEEEKESGSPDPNNTIQDMERHFLDRIRGRGPQVTSAMIGAKNVAVLEAITASMRKGKPAVPASSAERARTPLQP
ncbi:MAG: Gfo/Idh/MocA family oxidoreductase [Thaumarchaeota archaeon]|nr:Gfo/Idh/MocA family oxidoreductase [Nitrososphaerota archaeon]